MTLKVGEEVDGVVALSYFGSAYAEVRARVQSMYDAGIDRPALTVDIEFVQLETRWNMPDYAALGNRS